MRRIVLLLIALVFSAGVFAGEYEVALKKGKPVCLYLYTNTCGYCRKFNLIYYKLTKTIDKYYNFVKVDTDTEYGTRKMRQFGANYVPYVVLTKTSPNKIKVIDPACSIDYACIEKEMRQFIR